MKPTDEKRIELDVFKKAICLSVEIGALGSKRKVNASQVTVDADPKLINVSKTLLDSDELLAIKQLYTTVRQALYRVTLRPEIFRAGIYVLPLVLVEETDQQLTDYQGQLKDLVKRLAAKYPEIKERDKARLRSCYVEKDYVSLAKLMEAFYLEWSYINFGVPENLPADIREREIDKATGKVAQAAEQIQQLLRVEMLDLVAHIADRLEPGAGGKPRVFRDTLVSNVKDFLAVFQARNLTNDAELEQLCAKAQLLLDGMDPQVLRDRTDLRSRVAAGFAEIKSQLDTMVVTDRPKRQIDLEDEVAAK